MKSRCLVLLLLLSMKAGAELRWTGFSANGLWADPGNWESGILPGPNDDVILDNSIHTLTYIVRLPDFAVQVRSLQIVPSGSLSITLELPITNLITSAAGSLLERAFTTTGTGYTIVLGRGAVFINASGSTSGYSLRLNDSLQILQGGKYIHRSRTGHAEIVQQLSRRSGTETGVFRFENPDAASTISLSDRVFGSLQLSASASASGLVSYSASGTNPVLIRGDLVLEQGASLALNFDDTINVAGNCNLSNAVLNLASGNRSAVLLLQGNWLQAGGTVRATNSQQKTGTILLKGRTLQLISNTGILADSVIVDIMNGAGVQLTEQLRCPHGFRLSQGSLKTSRSNMLVLGNDCWLKVDSLAPSNFVDGPMTKQALNGGYFFFPVGRNGRQRWLATRGVSGDLTVEYHPETAYIIGTSLGAGIDHISQVEYWGVGNSIPANGQVELFYDHNLSGGVSELVSLRVAAFSGGLWKDAGNAATSGAAFASGSVTSLITPLPNTQENYFTLASSSSFTNVLPVLFLDLWLDRTLQSWNCNWRVEYDRDIMQYEIELSTDGIKSEQMAILSAGHQQQYFRYTLPSGWEQGYCRIKAIQFNGKSSYSDWVQFRQQSPGTEDLRLVYQQGGRNIQVESNIDQSIHLQLFDGMGRLLVSKNCRVFRGISVLQISSHALPAGIYRILLSDNKKMLASRSLFVQ